jgi:Arylsulfotransferase (ASST)
MALRQIKTTFGLALAATACVCVVAMSSAQAAATPPIGAFTTKGTWKFLSRPDLHPPKIKVLFSAGANKLAPGYFMIANFKNLNAPKPMVGEGGPLILDNKLRPVWFGPVGTNVVAGNLKIQTYQGKPALSWWEGVIGSTGVTTSGKDVVYSQQYKRVATLTGTDGWVISLHDLVISGQDAWVTAYKNVPMDLSPYGGPANGILSDSAVQEYDLKSGKLLRTWDALAHVPLSQSQSRPAPDPTVPWDAYHINSVQLTGHGTFLTSFRNTWAAYLVNMDAGGAIDWTLSGNPQISTFTLPASARFQFQHDAQLHSNSTVSVFDDACCGILGPGKFAPPIGPSRGLVLKLDMTHKTATVVQQYTRGSKFEAEFLGNTDVLANGNVAIGWGSQPFFSELTSKGKLLLDADLPTPNVNYRTFVRNWVGTPARPPSGVSREGKHGTLVFASWNGATEVTAWRVLAGRDAKHLAVVASRAKTGFETAIPLKSSYKKYKVQALDSRGHVLGTSPAFPSKKPAGLAPGY